jgi:hypothetical protein
MIDVATLKAARDALNALHPTYWFNELTATADGLLESPNDTTYYVIRLAVDPATADFDGEAYSRPVLTVQAWTTRRGSEYAALASADAALVALFWERITTSTVPGDGMRYGLTTDYVLTA